MWTYNQRTGALLRDGEPMSIGYSGYGAGKNNPAMESVHDVGPIPGGLYRIGEARDTETHGPLVMPLTPVEGTDTLGRSGFLIHGDSTTQPGAASHGCVILSRWARQRIADSDDRMLEVVCG